MSGQTVCVFCGRTGSRGFTQLSGNGDGTRDSYKCSSSSACEFRQMKIEVAQMKDLRPRWRARDGMTDAESGETHE